MVKAPAVPYLDPTVRNASPKRRKLDRLETAITKKRQKTKDAQAFRNQVWKRDGSRCRVCQKPVRRTLELVPEQGHVHHTRGRNVAPELKYDPNWALLVCAVCHAKIHAGEIKL